ncbi:MAG: hypothetical protein RLZZ308_474 [Candidatus Parcubacteria bacterium]|jgi:hypothetical protein
MNGVPHIIKDITVVLFSITLFYIVINNPITRPQAQVLDTVWSIELRQQPLVLGLAGHNYLALRNGEGEVQHELHGLPTDTRTGEWKYVGRTKYDILRIWEFSTSTKRTVAPRTPVSVTLLSGDKDNIMTHWEEARACGRYIDALHLPYPPYGISFKEDTRNSNSVAYTLALCMGVNPQHVGLFTPGWEKDLLGEVYE